MPSPGCTCWFCLPIPAPGELPALDVPGAGCSEHGGIGDAVNQHLGHVWSHCSPRGFSLLPTSVPACLGPVLSRGAGFWAAGEDGAAGWAPTEQLSALKLGQDNISCVVFFFCMLPSVANSLPEEAISALSQSCISCAFLIFLFFFYFFAASEVLLPAPRGDSLTLQLGSEEAAHHSWVYYRCL